MLIPFSELKSRFKINPQGVLHIGANNGEEAEAYYSNGVQRTVWIEAIPEVFQQLQETLKPYPNALAFNECVHSLNNLHLNFNVTNNNGQSSSFLPFGTHATVHPDVTVVRQISVTTIRLDKLLKDNNLDIADYDFINIDIQGAELFALRGFGELLKKVKYAYLEVNEKELYKGCALLPQIDEYMKEYGFERVDIKMAGDTGWGDAFYIQKELLSHSDNAGGNMTMTFIPAPELIKLQAEGRQHRDTHPGPVETITLSADLSFAKVVKKYRLPVRGVINAGSHHGNDILQYQQLGINNMVMMEPEVNAFQKMINTHKVNARFLNMALSEFDGNQDLYLCTGDDGRSNSFYAPKILTTQYPKIKFQGQVSVKTSRLDRLGIDIGQFNCLHLDVNGFELRALRGSLDFLHHCDYIYTKLYFAELYEKGCMATEVDDYLQQFGFARIDTDKVGKTWGYALYMKTKDPLFPSKKQADTLFPDVKPSELANAYLESGVENEGVVQVPESFRPHITQFDPVDNTIPFEEWFYRNFSFDDQMQTARVYLPIFWNSYYQNHDIRNKPGYLQELQYFINALDKEKKYYTVCTYPDGILNDVSGLDLTVFGVNAAKSTTTIPMSCQPHPYNFGDIDKDVFISYIGGDLHPLRKQLVDSMPKDQRKIYISTEEHTLEEYCRILARSRFVLCPVGFNEVNFRVTEALQYGAIPVKIYETGKMPKELDVMDVLLFPGIITDNVKNLIKAINLYEEEAATWKVNDGWKVVDATQDKIKEVYYSYYSHDGCKSYIQEQLAKEVAK
jgi:FkbM family methyltransferase